MPVPASSAPLASATLASSDRAPKLMSETMIGISSRSGLRARGPTTSSVPTATSSSCGTRASCAVTNCRSSQVGSSVRGTPMAATGPWWPYFSRPCSASERMSLTWGSAGLPLEWSWKAPW